MLWVVIGLFRDRKRSEQKRFWRLVRVRFAWCVMVNGLGLQTFPVGPDLNSQRRRRVERFAKAALAAKIGLQVWLAFKLRWLIIFGHDNDLGRVRDSGGIEATASANVAR